MSLFRRKPTLAEQVLAALREGTLPAEVIEELRRYEAPLASGGRAPPGRCPTSARTPSPAGQTGATSPSPRWTCKSRRKSRHCRTRARCSSCAT